MEYTVHELAEMAGVSARTLRYYDGIGLLCPIRSAENGYRLYREAEVDRLQQILFYRELGMGLSEIGAMLHHPAYNRLKALREYSASLLKQQEKLALLIGNVNKTILKEEGKIKMADKEKFEGMKRNLVSNNEQDYGKEIRNAYGAEFVEKSNARLMGLSQEEFEKMEELSAQINTLLEQAVCAGDDPEGEAGAKIASMHKEWLTFTWPSYSKKAHAGLVQMYTCDERFTAYYDKNREGCAVFLRDAVLSFLNLDESN